MSVEGLRTKLGSVELANPAVLASGVHGSSLSKVLDALRYGAGAAVTKSIGPSPREGYPEPTLVRVESGWLNAAGLPNPGAARFSDELKEIRGKSLPVFVSIFGGTPEEFGRVTQALDASDFLGYELNLSCPHVAGVGTEVGHDPDLVEKVVKKVKSMTRKPVFAKLSPNTERLIEVAGAAAAGGADGFSAVNTLRAMEVDIESGKPSLWNGVGGLSGPAIRPVALRCVYELYNKFDLPIMGCGGVAGWEQAVKFLLAGASAVQLGVATIDRFDIFNDLNAGILSYMERKGVDRLGQLVGAAHGRGGVAR